MSQQSEFSSDGEGTWIEWFCSHDDHFWFCEVDQQFIQDYSNLHGIKSKFTKFNQAMKMILKPSGPQQDQLQNPKFIQIYQEATDIYGLIHARFILTPKGLNLMRQKYLRAEFGTCPRVLCESQNVLPIGVSEQLKTCRVKVFCPRCEDIYNYQPKKKCLNIDGAYFGGAFPHILLMSFQDLKPPKNDFQFSPQIFGFKIHGHHGSSLKPIQKQHQGKHESFFLEDNSLTKTSLSKPKRKNNKKNR